MVSCLTLWILGYCYGSNNRVLGFLLTLVGSLGAGFSQALGEMTLYGITKSVNSFCVSGVSTGTGFAGILAILATKILDAARNSLGSWVSKKGLSCFNS